MSLPHRYTIRGRTLAELENDLREQLCAAAKAGPGIVKASTSLGIHFATMYRWLKVRKNVTAEEQPDAVLRSE
jgi:hypothetical protein